MAAYISNANDRVRAFELYEFTNYKNFTRV